MTTDSRPAACSRVFCVQFDGYAPPQFDDAPQAEGAVPQAARLQKMADQAEAQRGLALCEECALHSGPSDWTVPVKSFDAPCSFRVWNAERCDSAAPAGGAAPEEGQVLEVAEFKVVKVKASSAAAAPAETASFAIIAVPDGHPAREMIMINNDAYQCIHGDVNVRTIFIGLPCADLCVCGWCSMAPVTSLLPNFSPAAFHFWPRF